MADLDWIRQNGSIRYLAPQLKGSGIGVLFFFLLNPGLTFNEGDLQFYTGYSRPTLRAALRDLARFQLVNQLGERRVWALTANVRQLDFSDVAAAPDEEKNFFLPSSSSSDLSTSDQEELLTTSSPNEKIFSRLVDAGVFEDLAREHAGDEWVTEARIDAWLERLRGDPTVRSVGALLHTNLKRHLEPGEPPAPASHGQGWSICERCWTWPCSCNHEGENDGT
jgi:hypothetical protein